MSQRSQKPRTNAKREQDRLDKQRQRLRAKFGRPAPMLFDDTPPPGTVPSGLGSQRAVGRGTKINEEPDEAGSEELWPDDL